MKRLAATPLIITLLALTLLSPVAYAQAQPGPAAEELRGSWRAERLGDTVPTEAFLMYITFLDSETLKMDVVTDQGSETEMIRYTLPREGAITFFPNPEEDEDGETYDWSIREDGKLQMDAVDSEMVMVFSRYTPPAEDE